jgi:ankyrin repeat protein
MATRNPLFKFGVDIEGVDAEGRTALHRAAMFSDQDKVQQFVRISASVVQLS